MRLMQHTIAIVMTDGLGMSAIACMFGSPALAEILTSVLRTLKPFKPFNPDVISKSSYEMLAPNVPLKVTDSL